MFCDLRHLDLESTQALCLLPRGLIFYRVWRLDGNLQVDISKRAKSHWYFFFFICDPETFHTDSSDEITTVQSLYKQSIRMVSLFSLVFAASACLHPAPASPVDTDSHIAKHEARQAANCTNLTSVASTACWDDLNIPDYVVEWTRTVPNCQMTGGDGTECCHPQEPWTTCFLRLAYGNPDSDCTTLNSQQCALNQISPGLEPDIASKTAYVVRNIVVINNLFRSYYKGES